MPPKANKRLPQKGKGGRGWRPGGDKTLRTKQTRRGCRRTDAVSEPSHTHTHGPWLSQWWGDNRRFKATVVSWCTVDTRNCISITKQTALSSSASLSGRKMERYRVQSPDFNHSRGSTETGAEPLTQKQFHSCRNTELKYYKRLSFLPFLS